MSATAFQRARRLAAQKLGVEEEIVSLGYSEAMEVLEQPEPEAPPAIEDFQPLREGNPLTRDERTAQLKSGNWEELRDLLKSYELSTNKPKNVSWDDFAIPQILQHEGL